MSAIDVQNAKQIRDPMQVLIELDIPDETPLTYSGYSGTAKIYDSSALLDYSYKAWPMRKLADLKEDGFPLNGTCELYDSSTTPSMQNGKIGVRGHVGQDLELTATSSDTINGLTLSVTGAYSVTCGGTTSVIVGNQIVIQVNAASASMTFTPSDENSRVEVSSAIPGVTLVINNSNMVRADVSLRSDLSLVNQSLPESELNVDVYNDSDVTHLVASIPEDTPIAYSAGYAGDMSPIRKFYISGLITWKDGIMSIHAVDSVHFLEDIETYAPITEKESKSFINEVLYFLKRAGITPDTSEVSTDWSDNSYRWIIPKSTKARNLIAFANQCLNITDKAYNLLDGRGKLKDQLMFNYVDAGIPTLKTNPSTGTFVIDESDCGEVQTNVERPISKVDMSWTRIWNMNMPVGDKYATKVGTATFIKDVGTSLNFDVKAYAWVIGLYLGPYADNDIAVKLQATYHTRIPFYCTFPVVPINEWGHRVANSMPTIVINSSDSVGMKLNDGDIPKSNFESEFDATTKRLYSNFVPWDQAYDNWPYDTTPGHKITTASEMWNVLVAADIIDSDAESIDLDIYGMGISENSETVSYAGTGNSITYDYGEAPVIGQMSALTMTSSPIQIYPNMLNSPMYRSTESGSFRWKGDPRLQPRDIGQIKRLDGTYEDITLENITITHEGGGTYADITYRKGVI